MASSWQDYVTFVMLSPAEPRDTATASFETLVPRGDNSGHWTSRRAARREPRRAKGADLGLQGTPAAVLGRMLRDAGLITLDRCEAGELASEFTVIF